MDSRIVKQSAFAIVGIAVRTTNQDGRAQKDIGALWERFFRENVAGRIAERQSPGIYCVYTDYDSDFQGPYTTLLGYRVTSLDNIPEGLTGKMIPAYSYRLFVTKGKIPEALVATWMKIWQTCGDRAYVADFDIYSPDDGDPQAATVETYVSVKLTVD